MEWETYTGGSTSDATNRRYALNRFTLIGEWVRFVAVSAFMMTAFLAGMGVTIALGSTDLLVGGITGSAIAMVVYMLLLRRSVRRQIAQQTEARAEWHRDRERDVQARIAEAKATGAFDRFGPNGGR
ncbi:hypothetical protein [Pontivivens ytuae]|uniref:Uncharacterized protein n=1 Tax=Pontivivens ytuae TaxID=2789856 RepID=A0A7S9QCD7_9RHOB|nr:hypothetical protein [Pontivivens ytuae]QPH53720.1 hypothetical protein I0K15_18375 [Pontivivens ytuae]